MDTITALTVAGSVATAIGVIFTGIQVWLGRRQAVTDFEDTLAREYRELAQTIPTEALLGGTLSEEKHKKKLDEFYHYFDLCNTQVFLRQIGRVRWSTFKYWRDGIKTHFERPAFKRAWEEISQRAEKDFHELRRLRSEKFKRDPKYWKWKWFNWFRSRATTETKQGGAK